MAEDPTIGGRSRRFRVAVLLSVLLVLFASMLAVGAVNTTGPGVPIPGQDAGIELPVDDQSGPTDSSQDDPEASDPEDGSSDSENEDEEGESSSEDSGSSYGGTSSGGYPEQSTVGGPLELSNQPELRIESPEPSRWRLGAYDRYTGDGWERDGDSEPLREPLETDGSDPERASYAIHVEALRPFSSLATVWRPAYAETARDVFVTDQRGFVVDERIETNETYVTVTYGPPSEEEAKAATGTAPPAIQERYTQLPSDTPDRLERKTDEITADAETPYEAAEAVETWLKTNKEYTLDASHDRGNDVATEFVFEMDAGYCQYFATAMTAMMRTQDIPTRYVTGYTTGEQVGEDTYLARGKNAHAWVEVYFEGVGWVTFDPTSSSARIDAGRSEQSLDDQGDDEQESDQQEDDEQNDEEEEEQKEEETVPLPPYEIGLSPDPVPGQEVTVTVEKDEQPVAGVEVSFNDEVVGTTDDAGQVRATVPYATELTVSATPPTEEDTSTARLRPAAGGTAIGGGGTLFAPLAAVQTEGNSSVRYEIPTDVTVETGEIVVPARSVPANMSLNGSAVADLDVVVGGETVGSTDRAGNFTLPVPADAVLDENLSVRFVREEFVAEANVSVADAEIELETGFLKLPGSEAEVTVTAVDGDQELQLEEVPIRTNGGEVTAITDENGTAAVALPWSNEATATAVIGENTVTASVSGILLHLFGVAAVPVVALLGAGVWIRRNPERVRRFKQRAVGTLVTAGEWLRLIGHRVYTAAVAVQRRLRELAARVRNYFVRLREGITLEVLLSPVYYLAGLASGLVAWILALPDLLRELLSNDAPEHTEVGELGSESTAVAETAGETTESIPAYRRLRQCWYWLVRRVVRRPRTKTAVEVEKRALEKGLPRRPVRRLRRAFQDVEYGFADPDERVDVAEESVERLRENTEEREQ